MVAEAFEEALSRDPEQQRIIVVVDGEVNQLNYIEQQLLTDLTATVVLDFIHVLNTVESGLLFHPVGSEEVEQWVAENAEVIAGKVGTLGMRRLATRKDFARPTQASRQMRGLFKTTGLFEL